MSSPAQALDALERGACHEKTWQRVQASVGTYLTAATIAERFGFAVDPKSAVRSAERYCLKCTKLQGPWVKFDSFSQQLLFLFVHVAPGLNFPTKCMAYGLHADDGLHVELSAGNLKYNFIYKD